MTGKHLLGLFLLGLIVPILGCGKSGEPSGEVTSGPGADTAAVKSQPKLDITSTTTPEGVTNQFFKAFFSGDDKTAFSLLTKKAQDATRENFSAEASDTIKWKIRKTSKEADLCQVFVDVEDLNEQGTASREELVFAVRLVDSSWGVCGFSTNGLSVNFEERRDKSSPASAPADKNVQVGQAPSAQPLK